MQTSLEVGCKSGAERPKSQQEENTMSYVLSAHKIETNWLLRSCPAIFSVEIKKEFPFQSQSRVKFTYLTEVTTS